MPTATRVLPEEGAYLTDGERLVQVVESFKGRGIRVEDSSAPSEEFVIPVGKLARWRRVLPLEMISDA